MKKLMTCLIFGIFLISFVSAVQVLSPQEAVAKEFAVAKVAKEGEYTSADGKQVQINKGLNNRMRIQAENVAAETDLEIEQEMSDGQTMFKAKLSNGRNAEIKVMPDTASETALARLRLRVCTAERNCTLELKEVGKNDEAKAAYEMNAEKPSKFLGIFKARMKIKAQIDAETGEVIQSKKPWWAFLASESEEEAELEE